jgi:hypothetical protein
MLIQMHKKQVGRLLPGDDRRSALRSEEQAESARTAGFQKGSAGRL